MAEMAADLGECGKSSLAKGEWAGDVDLSLAYQRVGSVLQTAPGGAALEQVSSVVLAGVMFSMGVKSPQLLSRTREHTLDAWSDALSAGPRQTGEALLAAIPPGSPLANAMVVRAFMESEKMAVALLLALGADNSASLAEIGFRRIPMLALPPAAAGPAAAGAGCIEKEEAARRSLGVDKRRRRWPLCGGAAPCNSPPPRWRGSASTHSDARRRRGVGGSSSGRAADRRNGGRVGEV